MTPLKSGDKTTYSFPINLFNLMATPPTVHMINGLNK